MGTLTKVLSSQRESMQSQVEARCGEEVIAVGELRQGRRPSLAALVTGTALVEVLRPRRSKELPKRFALAVTPTRALAYSCISVSDEDGENHRVIIRGEERGCWPREAVSLEVDAGKPSDGILHLGAAAVPVCRPQGGDEVETPALIELISA